MQEFLGEGCQLQLGRDKGFEEKEVGLSRLSRESRQTLGHLQLVCTL